MRVFFILITVSSVILLKGQEEDRLFLTAGFGNYESAFIGLGYNLSSNMMASLTSGYLKIGENQKQFSATIKLNRKIILVKELLKLSISLKLIFWNHEDDNFIFSSLAFAPDIEIEYQPFLNPVSLYLNAGPNFNYQLKSIRKNDDVLGWPKKTAFNWSIGARFKI